MNTCTIKSIKKITCPLTKVYDITVPKNSNFILAGGEVVHNCMPYHYLKTAIYEKKVEIFKKCDLLTDELIGLERMASGKIDHTPDGINSKDSADAFCGSLYTASQFAEEYAYQYGENLKIGLEASLEDTSDEYRKQQFILGFQEELAKLYVEQNECTTAEQKQKQKEAQYYADISDGIIVL